MLALFYGLSGQFSLGLLGLRLEETLAGAAAGVLVAYFVFPVRTGAAIRGSITGCLKDLTSILAAVDEPDTDSDQLAGAARDLDRKLQNLRKVARPLLAEALVGRGSRDPHAWLQRMTELSYYGRRLTRLDLDWDKLPAELRRNTKEASSRLQHNLNRLAASLEDDPQPDTGKYLAAEHVLEDLDEVLRRCWKTDDRIPTEQLQQVTVYAHLLHRIHQAFKSLKNTL